MKKHILTADILMPGRTRWAVFDKKAERFYINIAKPSQIVAVVSLDLDGVAATYGIPATGPHGLDIDVEGRRLFCACDQGVLLTVDLHTRKTSHPSDLSGPPDVIFYNSRRRHLYVASGKPGTIDVLDTDTLKRVQTVKTDEGAHTRSATTLKVTRSTRSCLKLIERRFTSTNNGLDEKQVNYWTDFVRFLRRDSTRFERSSSTRL